MLFPAWFTCVHSANHIMHLDKLSLQNKNKQPQWHLGECAPWMCTFNKTGPTIHLPRCKQWWVIKKHSVTKPNAGVSFKVTCSSSGRTTSLVSLARPTTCKPVLSCAMALLSTLTAQYFGLIFRSLGEEVSMNGWHNLRSKVPRLRKNPSCACVVAKNSAIICMKQGKKEKTTILRRCTLSSLFYTAEKVHYYC